MKKKNHRTLFVFAVAILLNVMGGYKLFAQIDDRVCIEGHIFDKKTQEPICYAAIMLDNTNIGTTSDENGDFVFRKLKPGKYVLHISFIGYQKETYEVEVVKGAVAHAHIELIPKSTRLDDVVVSANRNETECCIEWFGRSLYPITHRLQACHECIKRHLRFGTNTCQHD